MGNFLRSMIFDLLLGAGCLGSAARETRSPPRAGGNIRHVLRSRSRGEGGRRTQQRMTLTVKSPISSQKAEYEGCATWIVHVACLLLMFSDGRLAMPTVDVIL